MAGVELTLHVAGSAAVERGLAALARAERAMPPAVAPPQSAEVDHILIAA